MTDTQRARASGIGRTGRRALAVAVAAVVALTGPGARRAEAQAESGPVLTTTLGLGDPIVGTDISALGGQQYHQNNQRNYWWNAQAGRWDGILPTASPPADSSSRWWLWHDLGGEPTPIALAESSRSSTPDAYWDAGESTLYVFFSRGNSGTSKFRRYGYDAVADRYVEDSRSGGVSAPVALHGGKRVTIIKSPNGHLWAGVNFENELRVSRSTDRGDTWAEPVVIKATGDKGEGHWVTFEVGGRTHVGFAVTEDGKAPDPKVHFIHLDQDEADWIDPARWTDETSLLPGWEGDERADDELSAVVFENRVFVVIETEPLGDARTQARPQLVVYERGETGGWVKRVITRYTTSGVNDAKRPTITVDAASRALVVSAGTPAFTHADVWYAPIDDLAGRDEQWSELRVFEIYDPEQDIYTTRTPLPRFPVTAESDLLLMIDDRGEAKQMWRQVVRANTRPVADAGPDQAVTSEAEFTLDGTASSDPDGDPLTYVWVQTAGPPAVIRDPESTETVVEGVTGPATLEFRLTVTDPHGAQDSDHTVVTVRAPK